MADQTLAPIIDALTAYIAEKVRPYHTPGHKQGRRIDSALRSILSETALKMDVSLMTELDDLHQPTGCILQAQQLAAELYGAAETFFVVQGTTGGIQAMLLAAVGPGDSVLVPRHVHRSVLSGLILTGARPVYMQPQVIPEWGLPWAIRAEVLQQDLQKHPEIKAVCLVNPTYYGVASDLARLVEISHAQGLPVLVDEAHGPHLKFHQDLPLQALAAGADVCAQSTHKLTGALTQCSMVHCQGNRIDRSRLQAMLSLIQTTSPNYLLLASLDGARRQLAAEGCDRIQEALQLARYVRQEIQALPGLFCFGREVIGKQGCTGLDETKLTVNVSGLGLTGKEAELFLRQQGIQAELCDPQHVLFLMTLADDREQADALVRALRNLCAQQNPAQLASPQVAPPLPPLPEVILTPREALFAQVELIPTAQSVGRISAETITFYPPGIPQICPGEQISAEVLDYCAYMKQAGFYLTGPADSDLKQIKVVK